MCGEFVLAKMGEPRPPNLGPRCVEPRHDEPAHHPGSPGKSPGCSRTVGGNMEGVAFSSGTMRGTQSLPTDIRKPERCGYTAWRNWRSRSTLTWLTQRMGSSRSGLLFFRKKTK